MSSLFKIAPKAAQESGRPTVATSPFPSSLTEKKAILFLLSGILLLSLFLSPGRLMSSDVGTRLTIARGLWKDGSPLVPQEKWDGNPGIKVKENYVTSYYGIGQSLILIPFDMVSYVVSHFLLAKWPDLAQQLERSVVVLIYGPLMSALWLLALFVLVRCMGFSARLSLFSSGVIFFATIVFPYAMQTIQEESLVGALLCAGFFHLVSWEKKRTITAATWVGFFFACAVTCRINSVFAAFIFLGFFLDLKPLKTLTRNELGSVLKGVSAGAAIPFIIWVTFNYWRFGKAFSTGYDILAGQFPYPTPLMVGISPTIVFELLFAWGKGLFFLSPPLVLTTFGLVLMRNKRPFLAMGIVFAFAASLLLSSKFDWYADGTESWGTRYQVHLVGFLAIPLAFFFAGTWSRTKIVGAWGIIALGLIVQSMVLLAPDSLEYIQNSEANKASNPTISFREDMSGMRWRQLPLRVKNTVMWFRGSLESSALSEGTREMIHNYVPNLWGPAFAKKRGAGAGYVLYAFWALIGFSGLLLTLIGGRLILNLPSTGDLRISRD